MQVLWSVDFSRREEK